MVSIIDGHSHSQYYSPGGSKRVKEEAKLSCIDTLKCPVADLSPTKIGWGRGMFQGRRKRSAFG